MKKLGFGMMRLPVTDPDNGKSVDIDATCRMVDAFLENGFTYFDTAYMYHSYHSENVVREALVERHPRDSFLLADKMPTMFLKNEEDLPRIFDEQLKKCGVDYFDYYLLHDINGSNYDNTAQRLREFEFVSEKKAAGQITHMGFSFHDDAELLERVLTDHPEVEFVQLQINYLDWEHEGIQSRLCYECACRHGKKVIVMEPVKGGTLASVPAEAEKLLRDYAPDASPASWAIRFAASLDEVIVVLSGMSNMDQLQDNMSFMKELKPINPDELGVLNEAVKIIHRSVEIPCTACGYCLEGCPKKIPIPRYFALYNTERLLGSRGFSPQEEYYSNSGVSYGLASDCVKCGKCETACPQHLQIREYLRHVKELFEG